MNQGIYTTSIEAWVVFLKCKLLVLPGNTLMQWILLIPVSEHVKKQYFYHWMYIQIYAYIEEDDSLKLFLKLCQNCVFSIADNKQEALQIIKASIRKDCKDSYFVY